MYCGEFSAVKKEMFADGKMLYVLSSDGILATKAEMEQYFAMITMTIKDGCAEYYATSFEAFGKLKVKDS